MQTTSVRASRTTTSFTILPQLLAELKEEAARQNRTVSNLVETLIERYLRELQNPMQRS
jgi:predicted DNA-binding ribbon-helix-helix protein